MVRKLQNMPYAQAQVIITSDDTTALQSYNTIAAIIDSCGWLTVNGLYSATTRKHISAFMREYGRGYSYYDAKDAYEHEYSLNLYTGEKMLIAIPIENEDEDWQRLEETGENPVFLFVFFGRIPSENTVDFLLIV